MICIVLETTSSPKNLLSARSLEGPCSAPAGVPAASAPRPKRFVLMDTCCGSV